LHVISKKRLQQFWGVHPEAEKALANWFRVARKAEWRTFREVRSTYPSADQVGQFVVFNIGGNKYRLIAEIYYPGLKLLVRHVLTHAEYDKGKWKT
jgi:mRNA interferase HigB